MLHRRSLLTAPALLAAAPLAAQGVWNPQRPIRILVGFAPGGGTDITTRTLTNKLQALLGQPIIVENRPGAGGNLASEATVNSPSDGHTLMMGTIASLVLNPILAKLPFDVVTDLTPISRSVEVTNILVVPMDRPWRSLPELIAAARARPDQLTYGSSGVGSAGHLGGALLDSMAKISTVHVPYRGGGQLITDLISGRWISRWPLRRPCCRRLKRASCAPWRCPCRSAAGFCPIHPPLRKPGLCRVMR